MPAESGRRLQESPAWILLLSKLSLTVSGGQVTFVKVLNYFTSVTGKRNSLLLIHCPLFTVTVP